MWCETPVHINVDKSVRVLIKILLPDKTSNSSIFSLKVCFKKFWKDINFKSLSRI